MTYEPAPEGHYRPFIPEYEACKEAGLSIEKLVSNTAHSAHHDLLRAIHQTHLILEGGIPEIKEILKKVELDSMKINEEGLCCLMPYTSFTVEECKHMQKKPFYEKFYKSTADKILFAEIFKDNERYQDMAKWIKNNFDRFVLFYDAFSESWRLEDEELEKLRNLESQVFMIANHDHTFVRNLDNFIDFFEEFGHHMHPMLHLGVDAPVYNPEETRTLIDRFYNAVKGVNRKNFKKQLDGQENHEKLKEYRANFLEHCTDTNPDELMKLADTANYLYHSEWCFMYQGAPRNVSLVLPRWVITLEEEFAGDWSGSCHPLLGRGCNASAYNEEACYIDYIRC